ncbi:MAG: hypothetical protein EA406_06075 [Rhodospirillales bacterium]|nr:MAG: hypothetical protein EA406_06075 [Rhodospirillales bacterium]
MRRPLFFARNTGISWLAGGADRRYRDAMKRIVAPALLAMAALPLTAACTELYKGPQVVRHSDSSFYVRHIPWIDGDARVDALAADLCREVDGEVTLTDQQQVYPFDIRYATYRCILPPPDHAPTRAPGLKPDPAAASPLYEPFELPILPGLDTDPLRDARHPVGDEAPA